MFLSDTVKSIANTYVHYCWEKSTDAVNWVSTGTCGTKIPTLINGMWQYVVDTAFVNVAADSATYYRLKVATTINNLSDANCSTNNSQKIFLKVYDQDCHILETNSLSLTAEAVNDRSVLRWKNLFEKNIKLYNVEKSIDGKTFINIGNVKSNGPDAFANYQFEDPIKIEESAFYRIKSQHDNNNKYIYSNIVSLSNKFVFKSSASNPFIDEIKLQTTTPKKGVLQVRLFDTWGRLVTTRIFNLHKGSNNNLIGGLQGTNTGLYILRLELGGTSIGSKLLKTPH